MSILDYRVHKLSRVHARKLIAEVANYNSAKIRFSKHALEEIEKDDLTTVDIFNVIKSPAARIVREGEMERGSYRYRLETNNIAVIVSFISETSFVVVTAWRK